jgi:hypothetical protein
MLNGGKCNRCEGTKEREGKKERHRYHSCDVVDSSFISEDRGLRQTARDA